MENKYSKNKRCEDCHKRITNNEAWFSLVNFGKELCYNDQAPYKLKKQHEKNLRSL